MANILIWMSPEPGHILPTIKPARDLSNAGHTVVYQVPESIRKELEDLRFPTIGFFNEVTRPYESSLHQPSRSANWHYWAISRKYPGTEYPKAFRRELVRAVSAVNAHLMIVDGVFDELLNLHMHEALPPSCNVARLYIHLPYREISATDCSPEKGPVVFLSPKEFEIPEFLNPNAFYTESGHFEEGRCPEFSWPSLDQELPLVYCSFGSQLERYPDVEADMRTVIAAAQRGEFQLILNAGIFAPKLQPSAGPNVCIYHRVPQLDVLQKASAMLLHGGFGSLKDCIYHQVPMLILPQKWDQPSNGMRVCHHGLGLTLSREQISEQSIVDSICTLVHDPNFKTNLATMRDIFIDRDKQEPTRVLVESILNGECVKAADHTDKWPEQPVALGRW